MSEGTASATALTSQYISQVAGDLERNVKEQEHVSAELSALQEQLTALQHDHGVLLSMQQALGVPAPGAAPSDAGGGAAVPSPRKRATGASAERRAAKTAAVKPPEGRKRAKRGGAKSVAGKSGAGKGTRPTLVDLLHRHLTEQHEPRSAAEVAKAVADAHPDRSISTNVVRTTLENLVARSLAQRNKQGSSVFYTASTSAESASESTPASEEGTRPVTVK
ncbi:BlaI/MecI/CopY family transcriptional regulator [Streptomyces sp. NPDC002250]|uniref:BlaI/MecI/CopY family transcriptional regulator n=1 Tax=Streptomyces sp. NPDC002250 TaxID=3364641 RepID=UPI0036A2EE41